eukprot:COSAG06_NODE_60671_length_270_cov_0.602339_1_plen_38_part_01
MTVWRCIQTPAGCHGVKPSWSTRRRLTRGSCYLCKVCR